MKALKLFAFLLPLSIFTLSCKEDLCKNVTCQNGGSCKGNGLCECPVGFEGNFCERERIPRSMSIFGIEILEYPTTRLNGTGWDPSDGPDVYPKIILPPTNAVVYKHPTYVSNALSGGLPFYYPVTTPVRITDVTNALLMQMYDYDTLGSDELMTQALFKLYESGKGFPPTIEIGFKGSGNYSRLYVTYEF